MNREVHVRFCEGLAGQFRRATRHFCQRCPVKYAWIAEQGQRYPLVDMCDALEVSISGYRAWKRGGQADRKRLTDAQMLALTNSRKNG